MRVVRPSPGDRDCHKYRNESQGTHPVRQMTIRLKLNVLTYNITIN